MEQWPHIYGALSGSNAISISYGYSKFSPPMLFTLCSGAFALFLRRANHASLGPAVLLCLFHQLLGGDAQIPSFGTQGRRNGNPPKPHTHKGEVTSLHTVFSISICDESY